MPARVGEGDGEVGVCLLGALDSVAHGLAGLQQAAAAVDVQHHLRALQPAREFGGGGHVGLFVARQRQHHVPAGPPALGPQFRQHGDYGRDVELVVRGAAPVDVAVLHHRGERIARPVLGLGLDHVHVARDHDGRLLRVLAGIARDQERRVRERLDGHLGGREATGHQLRLQELGVGDELVASRDGAIADALRQDLQRLGVQGRVGFRRGGERGRGEERGGEAGRKGSMHRDVHDVEAGPNPIGATAPVNSIGSCSAAGRRHAASISVRARWNTASNISAVSRPVFVLSREQ